MESWRLLLRILGVEVLFRLVKDNLAYVSTWDGRKIDHWVRLQVPETHLLPNWNNLPLTDDQSKLPYNYVFLCFSPVK